MRSIQGGKTAIEYFGMSMTDFAKDLFKEMGEAELAADRILDPAKSIAETVSVHLKQPAPPVMAR